MKRDADGAQRSVVGVNHVAGCHCDWPRERTSEDDLFTNHAMPAAGWRAQSVLRRQSTRRRISQSSRGVVGNSLLEHYPRGLSR